MRLWSLRSGSYGSTMLYASRHLKSRLHLATGAAVAGMIQADLPQRLGVNPPRGDTTHKIPLPRNWSRLWPVRQLCINHHTSPLILQKPAKWELTSTFRSSTRRSSRTSSSSSPEFDAGSTDSSPSSTELRALPDRTRPGDWGTRPSRAT